MAAARNPHGLHGAKPSTISLPSPAALSAGVATGVQFHPTDAVAFGQALRQLVALHGNAKLWAKVQANAMKHPVGWETSAAAYAALYEGLVG